MDLLSAEPPLDLVDLTGRSDELNCILRRKCRTTSGGMRARTTVVAGGVVVRDRLSTVCVKQRQYAATPIEEAVILPGARSARAVDCAE